LSKFAEQGFDFCARHAAAQNNTSNIICRLFIRYSPKIKILKIKLFETRRFIFNIFAVAADKSTARLERFDARFLFPQNVIDSKNAAEKPVNSTTSMPPDFKDE